MGPNGCISDDVHIRWAGAFAGLGSGFAKVTVGHAFDTVKTRMQCSPSGTYHGAIDCLVRIIRQESFFALYKGMTPPLIGQGAIDSTLLGSLHNYRRWLMLSGFAEPASYERDGQTENESQRLTLLGHGIAGLGAGFTSAIVATPVENLKVKLQVQSQRTASRQFQGTLDCALQVFRIQGILHGLWRGHFTSTLYRSSFFWMFFSIEGITRAVSNLNSTPYELSKGAIDFWAAGIGSISFWIFAIPIDNVKNRIFAAPLGAPHIPALTVTRQLWRTEGMRGFTRGFVPSVIRAFPANACSYFTFNWIMKQIGEDNTRLA